MTTDIDKERAALAAADKHIADGERMIAEQELRIAHLRADGHEVTKFEDMLATFEATLIGHRRHRELILEHLAELGAR